MLGAASICSANHAPHAAIFTLYHQFPDKLQAEPSVFRHFRAWPHTFLSILNLFEGFSNAHFREFPAISENHTFQVIFRKSYFFQKILTLNSLK